MWLVWTIVGGCLGWWGERLWTSRPPRDAVSQRAGSSGNADRDLALALLRALDHLSASRAGPTSNLPAPSPDASAIGDMRRAWLVRAALLLITFLAVTSFAVALYFRPDFPRLSQVEALLLSPRILALASGLAIGILASRYRQGIGLWAHDFYQALLGTEKSSWVLQVAAFLAVLFGITLFLEPDLLGHVESFRFGDVEAKFSNVSSVSTATREAVRVTENFTRIQVTTDEWIGFSAAYLDGSARGSVDQLFDNSVIGPQRRLIRNLLFQHYIEPLAILIDCLDDIGRVGTTRRNEELLQLAETFRGKVLREADKEVGLGASFKERDWIELIGMMDRQIVRMSKILSQQDGMMLDQRCPIYGMSRHTWGQPLSSIRSIENFVGNPERIANREDRDAKKLSKWTDDAVERLKGDVKERTYRLSYIDPYVIDAMGDLLALTLGMGEKATFLSQVKEAYPKEMRLIQPGLINLQFQTAVAKNLSEGPWPLEEKIDALDQAMNGVDFVIGETRLKAADARSGAGAGQPVAREGGEGWKRFRPAISSSTDDNYDDILDAYFVVKFQVITGYIETYYKRVLAGDTISEEDRIRWMSFYRQTETILDLGEVGVVLAVPDLGAGAVSEQDIPEWSKILRAIETEVPDFMFDVRVGMALSSVMLAEDKNHKASRQACAIAHHYLSRTKESLPEMSLPPLKLDNSKISRLRGNLQQIDARLDASCGGT